MAYMWDWRKKIENPDGAGDKTVDCGDTIAMYLDVKDGIVQQLCFELDGCLNTNPGKREISRDKYLGYRYSSWSVNTFSVFFFYDKSSGVRH